MFMIYPAQRLFKCFEGFWGVDLFKIASKTRIYVFF